MEALAYVQCPQLIPAHNAWSAPRPVANYFPEHGFLDDLLTKRSLLGPLMCLTYFRHVIRG